MFRDSRAVLNMNNSLIKKDKEIERIKKILADHNERIRILEIAVQHFLDMSVSYEEDFCELEKAIAESHKIALKEYP